MNRDVLKKIDKEEGDLKKKLNQLKEEIKLVKKETSLRKNTDIIYGKYQEGGNMIDGGSRSSSNNGSTPSLSQGMKYLNKQSGGFRYGIRSRKKREENVKIEGTGVKNKENKRSSKKNKKIRR